MLNAKSSERNSFLSPKILPNYDLLGGLEIRGKKGRDFYCKGISLPKNTSFELFCVKVRWGLTPRAERGKSQKVSDSHRNDVSLLTRAACDGR